MMNSIKDKEENSKSIHDMLIDASSTSKFVINDRYACRFDVARSLNDKPLFSNWSKNENCMSRSESESDVLVYDIRNSKNMMGKIVLAEDDDLVDSSRYTAALYVKDIGAKTWDRGSLVMKISDFEK